MTNHIDIDPGLDSNSNPDMARWFGQLQQRLQQLEGLWRPQPFKQHRPAWCEGLPQLAAALLALDDSQYLALAANDEALSTFLGRYVPDFAGLQQLTELPDLDSAPTQAQTTHWDWEVPGRKWQQIERFSRAMGTVAGPLLEWCGGKGHLGRLLALGKGAEVTTLERQDALCSEGERLAARAGVSQIFRRVDVLSPQSPALGGMHAVALHACGELHRQLVRRALSEQTLALDIAPCCYHLGASGEYRAFSPQARLSLSRDDLRLAVTGGSTASARELRLRDREMAWKLGFIELRSTLEGNGGYRNLRPVDKCWLRLGFEGFCRALAAREGLELTTEIDWAAYETLGWRRQREVMRLSLPRHAVRRALELWLVLDMAQALQQAGYRVRLQHFCPEHLSPRNILLSARRADDPRGDSGYA